MTSFDDLLHIIFHYKYKQLHDTHEVMDSIHQLDKITLLSKFSYSFVITSYGNLLLKVELTFSSGASQTAELTCRGCNAFDTIGVSFQNITFYSRKNFLYGQLLDLNTMTTQCLFSQNWKSCHVLLLLIYFRYSCWNVVYNIFYIDLLTTLGPHRKKSF